MENLEKSTYRISYNVDVYEDSFKNGELENVNYYDGEFITKANNPKDAIKDFFENELFFDIDFKYMETIQDENLNGFNYSVLCNNDNEEVKTNDSIYIEWKKDNVMLYTNNVNFNIYEIKETKILDLNK